MTGERKSLSLAKAHSLFTEHTFSLCPNTCFYFLTCRLVDFAKVMIWQTTGKEHFQAAGKTGQAYHCHD